MEKDAYAWEIRPAHRDEWQDAMALVWKTFLRFESPDYSEEGIQSFQDFITDAGLYRMFLTGSYEMIVAVENEKIIGVISVRNISHISLLFVDFIIRWDFVIRRWSCSKAESDIRRWNFFYK